MSKLDAVDKQILHLLQNDAKSPIKEIADKLNMTSTPVFERIKRLERNGYIRAYTAVLDRHKVGFSLLAFCSVSLEKHHNEFIKQFERDVQKLSEVQECYHTAGMYDYLLKVVSIDMESYHHFVAEKLASLDNIGKVQSFFVMNDVKDLRHLPV